MNSQPDTRAEIGELYVEQVRLKAALKNQIEINRLLGLSHCGALEQFKVANKGGRPRVKPSKAEIAKMKEQVEEIIGNKTKHTNSAVAEKLAECEHILKIAKGLAKENSTLNEQAAIASAVDSVRGRALTYSEKLERKRRIKAWQNILSENK